MIAELADKDLLQLLSLCHHSLDKCGKPFFGSLHESLKFSNLGVGSLLLLIIHLLRILLNREQALLDSIFEAVNIDQLVLCLLVVIIEDLVNLSADNLSAKFFFSWSNEPTAAAIVSIV
jgi:hypothetical protein